MCSGSTRNFSRRRFVAEDYPRNGYQATSDLPTANSRPNDSSVDPVHMASDRRPVLVLRPAFRTLFLTRYQFGNLQGRWVVGNPGYYFSWDFVLVAHS